MQQGPSFVLLNIVNFSDDFVKGQNLGTIL